MATEKVVLDKRRKDLSLINLLEKTDLNKYPLNIRIYKDDLYRDISLKYKFSITEWIEEENRVDKTV